MMETMYYPLARPSLPESLKILEADIQHANALAAAIPRAKGGTYLQMKLVYNNLAPIFLFLLQWLDCSCTCIFPRYFNPFHVLVYKVYTDGRPTVSITHGRKATLMDFYAVILPSLQLLHGYMENWNDARSSSFEYLPKKKIKREGSVANVDVEREDECGICLEPCTKMVLPNCCHVMCIKCYRNWNTKSESCPFCRGSMKRVNSEDLWVLACNDDVVDVETVSKEDLLRFYLYINSLPKDYPEDLFFLYYEYLI